MENYEVSKNGVNRATSVEMVPLTPSDKVELMKAIELSGEMVDKTIDVMLILKGGSYSLVEKVGLEVKTVVHDADLEFLELCSQNNVPQNDVARLKDVGRKFYLEYASNDSRSYSNMLYRKGYKASIPVGTKIRDLNAKRLKDVIDPGIRDALERHLSVNGGDFKKAFRNKKNMPVIDGETVIPSFRVIGKGDIADNGEVKNKDYSVLVEAGILPVSNFGSEFSGHFAYSVCKQAHKIIASYEERSKNHSEKKAAWQAAVEANPRRALLERYEFFVKEAGCLDKAGGGFGSIVRWKAKNYVKFIKAWRKEIRVLLIGKLADDEHYVFTPKDETSGYQAEFLQQLFDNFRDLWASEDIIGDESFVKLIAGSSGYQDDESEDSDSSGGMYHFFKDHVNIAKTSAYGKKAQVLLGENLMHYSIDFCGFDSGDWLLRIDNPFKKGDSIRFRVFKGSYFRHLSVAPSDDDSNWKHGQYRIEFSKLANNVIRNVGNIREPVIRLLDGKLMLTVPVSGCRQSSVNGRLVDYVESNKVRSAIKNYYVSSSPTNVKQNDQEKHFDQMPDSHLAVGIDVGLNPTVRAVISIVRKNKEKRTIERERVACVGILENANKTEAYKRYSSIHKRIIVAKMLATWTKKFKMGNETDIPDVFVDRNGRFEPLDWQEITGLNKAEYLKEISAIHYDPFSKIPLLEQWWRDGRRVDGSSWSLKAIVSDISSDVKSLRDAYRLSTVAGSDSARKHVINNNRVDSSTYMKMKTVQSYISLIRMFSGNGADVCSSLNDYVVGLRKHISNSTSAAIVAIVRDWREKLQCEHAIMFVEDLEARTSSWDSKGDNKLKSLWATGDLTKMLGEKAEINGIEVVAVDPSMTSQMDSETQMVGFRDKPYHKENLYVERNGAIEIVNADANAALNVLERGLSQHRNLNDFAADKVGDGLYRILGTTNNGKKTVGKASSEKSPPVKVEKELAVGARVVGKRRTGSLYAKTGFTSVLLKHQENDELVVCNENPLSKGEKAMKPIREKTNGYPRVIYNGGKWFLKHELAGYVAGFKDRYLSQSKEEDSVECEVAICEPQATI